MSAGDCHANLDSQMDGGVSVSDGTEVTLEVTDVDRIEPDLGTMSAIGGVEQKTKDEKV